MTSNRFTRRSFLGSASVALTALSLRAQKVSTTDVTTPRGVLRGESAGDVHIFRGIPFAEPPVGPLRFRAPVAIRQSWSTPRDATRFAASAIQQGRSDTSEDCLYLNVFAPNGKGPFPVFFWIHGGGFTGGSPNDGIFDGSGFARQGIIVVTVTYRLGVFGFLDWSPILGPDYADSANNALRDLILGLRWVQQNIGSFGGDASRVTIGGESAGAKLADMLMGVAEAKPLFAQVISESGGAERIRAAADSSAVSKTFLECFHRVADAAADPKTATAETLITSQRALTDAWDGNFPLRAESGGALLPYRAIEPIAKGNTSGKRLLIGTNRDESALFLGSHAAQTLTQRNLGNVTLERFTPVLEQYRKLYPQMTSAQLNIRALTAEEYWMPSIRVAEAHAKGGGTTYFYRLDEEAATGPFRGEAYHSFDLSFVWQHLAKGEDQSAQTLSRQMHDAWAEFIKGAAPAAAGLPAWPQWNPKTRPTMILNDTSTVEQQPLEAELRLWGGFRFD